MILAKNSISNFFFMKVSETIIWKNYDATTDVILKI